MDRATKRFEAATAMMFVNRSIDSLDRNDTAVAVGHLIRAVRFIVDTLTAPAAGEQSKPCTCVGSCKGAAGLGVGWHCVMDRKESSAEIAARATSENVLHAQVVSFMSEAMVSLSGVVCTPEQGYVRDGGLRQLLTDLQSFRKQYDAVERNRRELSETLVELKREIMRDRGDL